MAHAAELELPFIPRTSTDGALTMQVYVDGCYHRRLAPGSVSVPALSHTSCGKPIHSEFSDVRREELCEPLCQEGCFTEFELKLAAERQQKENDDVR